MSIIIAMTGGALLGIALAASGNKITSWQTWVGFTGATLLIIAQHI